MTGKAKALLAAIAALAGPAAALGDAIASVGPAHQPPPQGRDRYTPKARPPQHAKHKRAQRAARKKQRRKK